jgi:hypothetical protein
MKSFKLHSFLMLVFYALIFPGCMKNELVDDHSQETPGNSTKTKAMATPAAEISDVNLTFNPETGVAHVTFFYTGPTPCSFTVTYSGIVSGSSYAFTYNDNVFISSDESFMTSSNEGSLTASISGCGASASSTIYVSDDPNPVPVIGIINGTFNYRNNSIGGSIEYSYNLSWTPVQVQAGEPIPSLYATMILRGATGSYEEPKVVQNNVYATTGGMRISCGASDNMLGRPWSSTQIFITTEPVDVGRIDFSLLGYGQSVPNSPGDFTRSFSIPQAEFNTIQQYYYGAGGD